MAIVAIVQAAYCRKNNYKKSYELNTDSSTHHQQSKKVERKINAIIAEQKIRVEHCFVLSESKYHVLRFALPS